MRTAYSVLQQLNISKKTPEEGAKHRARADIHLKFVASLYKLQVTEGRYCLHEHPWSATSWSMPAIHKLINTGHLYSQRFNVFIWYDLENQSW